MPRKVDEAFDEALQLEKLSPKTISGRPNPDHYRERLEWANRISAKWGSEGRVWPNHKTYLDGLKAECDLAGIDYRTIADNRSDLQVAEDIIRGMLAGTEDMFALVERKIDACEKAMDLVDKHAEEAVNKQREITNADNVAKMTKEEMAVVAARGKRLRGILTRIRTLQNRARNPVPVGNRHPRDDKFGYLRAGHLMRFFLYVFRTSTPSMGFMGTDINSVGLHHVEISMFYWIMRFGVHMHRTGAQEGGRAYGGLMIVVGPGHGKTSVGIAALLYEYARRPHLRSKIVNAVEDGAIKILQAVADAMGDNTAAGDRFHALFPHVRVAQKSSYEFRIDTPERSKSPSCTANGVMDAVSGFDADLLYVDDPVDQAASESETIRKRTLNRFDSTWLTRLRGKGTFVLWITTLWHMEDASCVMISRIKKGQLNWHLYRNGCGGPKDGFRPVWTEAKDRQQLRQEYERSPIQYSTVWMCDPETEQAKLVPSVAYYPSTFPNGLADPLHDAFLKDCVRYLSVDPAISEESHADYTGMLYVGVGDLVWKDGDHERRTTRARILEAWRVRATSTDVAEDIGRFVRNNKVDHVIIETGTGVAAVSQIVRQQFGLNVIEFKPQRARIIGGRSKRMRLQECQALLDASKRSSGIIPVCEFPGVWEGQMARTDCTHDAPARLDNEFAVCTRCGCICYRLKAPDSVAWLVEEVTKFGFVTHDDGLDALTQLLLTVKSRLPIGEGIASRELNIHEQKRNPAITAMLAEFRESAKPGDFWTEEAKWHAGQYA